MKVHFRPETETTTKPEVSSSSNNTRLSTCQSSRQRNKMAFKVYYRNTIRYSVFTCAQKL